MSTFLMAAYSEPVEYDLPNHALNVLEGLGEYAIHIEMPNRQLEYLDELRGETGIDILVSDQGAGALERTYAMISTCCWK